MKYFVVADVHGFYAKMDKALKAVGFDKSNPEHIFVSLGDAMDRGEQPEKVLQFMLSVPTERRILIRGNHEDLMEQAINRRYFYSYDLTNGTVRTTFLLTGKQVEPDVLDNLRLHPLYNEYIANCVDYHETAGAIFVHGWIPHYSYAKGFNTDSRRHDYVDGWRDADRERWEAARWENGMESWADGVREPGKTIFCGHCHTSWAREVIDHTCTYKTCDPADFAPWVREGIVALDACTAWSGVANCYVWEDKPLPGMIK
jgi:predicted phosphodiesterase